MSLAEDMKQVARLLRPERRHYAMGLGSLFAVNLSDVVAPLFLAMAIELTEVSLRGGSVSTPAALRWLGVDATSFTIVSAVAVYVVLQIIANVFRYPMLMWTAVPSHRIGQTVRRMIAGHLLSQSQSFYDRAKSGDLMSIATADVMAVRMMVGPGILVGADTLILVSLVLIIMFSLSWQLALITLLPLPIIYAVTNKLSHLEYEGFEVVQADLADMTERVRESYAGIRIIQGYAREEFDRERFEGFSMRHYSKNMVLARIRSAFHPTLDFMLGVSTILVLVFGGIWIVEGQIAISTFVAFLFLVRYLSGPMIGFGWSISLFQRGRASLRRILRLVDTPIRVFDHPEARPLHATGALEFRDLTFVYESAEIPAALVGDDSDECPRVAALRDVDVRVEPGQRLGIFGPVGSGKTTMARVLTRMYDPPRGTVFVDGVDVLDITLSSLREQVVLAPQETFLFSTTVERNLTLSRDDTPTRDDVVQWAQLAHLHDEVVGFEDGYDTVLGERGVTLSGGQRQRLAIARAISADPRILVLDDCLSAVDSETEHAILQNLRDVFDQRTGVIISHRVRAVRECDVIVVLDEGRMTAVGTHDELIRGDGYYAEIAAQQLREEREAATHEEAS